MCVSVSFVSRTSFVSAFVFSPDSFFLIAGFENGAVSGEFSVCVCVCVCVSVCVCVCVSVCRCVCTCVSVSFVSPTSFVSAFVFSPDSFFLIAGFENGAVSGASCVCMCVCVCVCVCLCVCVVLCCVVCLFRLCFLRTVSFSLRASRTALSLVRTVSLCVSVCVCLRL
jgi:hypothetical protein